MRHLERFSGSPGFFPRAAQSRYQSAYSSKYLQALIRRVLEAAGVADLLLERAARN
jgi:hypothetical protein